MKSLQIRATGASCKECRRLKIKCDKQVPCGTCTKRGLQSLCPDGQLSSTKGSRYVLASAEESWQRIQALCVRVQDLEFALERAHSALVASNPSVAASTSGSTNRGSSGGAGSGGSGAVDRHPLLDPELIKIGQDPRAIVIGKSTTSANSGDGPNRGSLSTFTGAGGPNDVPVAQMGTMKLSKSGSFRWMATTALPGMVLDAFGDGVPEQDFEHAVSPDQYPDHHHSNSHQRQGSFSSVSFPFPVVGDQDATSPITPTSATTMGGGAATTNTNTATHFISPAFGSTATFTQSGPLSFGSVQDLKAYAIRQLPSSQQALHLIDTYFQFSWHWPVIISRQTVVDTLYTPAYATSSSSSTPSTSSNPLPQHSQQSVHHGSGAGVLAETLSTFQLASLFSILAMGALYDPTSDATCTEFKTRRKIARALFFASSTFTYSNAVAAAAAVFPLSNAGSAAGGAKVERHFSPGAVSEAPSNHTNGSTSSSSVSGSAVMSAFGASAGANNWDWVRSPRTVEEMESLLLIFRISWPFMDTSPMENYEFLSWGVKVACKLGLHNDPEPLNLSLEEANRRRRVFWALWFHDSLMSLNFGQPPTLTRGFVNCQPPRNTSDHGDDLHPRLTIVIQDLLRHFMESGPSPPYSSVLLLDRKIREIDPMKHAAPIHDLLGSTSATTTGSANPGAGSTASTAVPEWRQEISHAFSKGLKNMLLMSLHKTYFSYALLRPEENTDTGKLALSISAMYEGATGLLECAQIVSRNASWLQARYSPSWIHYQTSCMVLYAFPMYLPSSPKAEEAMKTADLAVSGLFQAHGRDCGVAAAGLPSLLKCQEKAKASMAAWQAGQWKHPMANNDAGATATTAVTAVAATEDGLPTEVFFNEKLVITSTASPAYNNSHGSRGSTPSDMMATASPSNFESNLGGNSGGTDGGNTGGASGSVFGGESSCSSSAFQNTRWMSNGIDSPIIVSPDANPASFPGAATGSYFSPAPGASSADLMHEERMEDPTVYGRSQPMEWSNAAPVITKVETPPPPPINMMYSSQQMYSPQSQVSPTSLLQVPSPAEDYPAPVAPLRRVRGLSRARSFPSDHVANIYPPISSVSPHMYQPMVSPHSLSPHSISPPTPSTLTPNQHGVYPPHHHFQTTHTPPPQISHVQRPSHHHHDSYGQWINQPIPDNSGYHMAPTMHYASPSQNHHQLYPHHRHSQPSLHTLPHQSYHNQSPQGDPVAPAIPIHVLEQSWNNFSGQQR